MHGWGTQKDFTLSSDFFQKRATSTPTLVWLFEVGGYFQVQVIPKYKVNLWGELHMCKRDLLLPEHPRELRAAVAAQPPLPQAPAPPKCLVHRRVAGSPVARTKGTVLCIFPWSRGREPEPFPRVSPCRRSVFGEP